MSQRNLLDSAIDSTAELGRLVVGARSLFILASSFLVLGMAIYALFQSYRVRDPEDAKELRNQSFVFFASAAGMILMVFLNLYLTGRYPLYAATQGVGFVI